MTYRDVLDAAVKLLCEDVANGYVEDYAERAPYVLATFDIECAAADRAYRQSHGLQKQQPLDVACVALEDEFRLHGVFYPAALYYLSAMLVMDENEVMGERFFELYSDAISSILASLPATAEKIVDSYHLI